MSKDIKGVLKYLGIIFIAVLLAYRLPHNSYSVIEYIIRPIRYGNGSFSLGGIVLVIIFIIGIRGLFKLERFKYTNKMAIFLVLVLALIPAMTYGLDFARTGYYVLKNEGLKAVDLSEADISLVGSNEDITINFSLKVIDYGREPNKFKIRAYLPKELSEYTGKEYYEFKNDYKTSGKRDRVFINERIPIEWKDSNEHITFASSRWYWQDCVYELYNEEDSVKFVHHGQ